MLTPSLEKRIADHLLSGKPIDEAIRLGFEEEENLFCSLLDGGFLSEKGKQVADVMVKRIYEKLLTRT